MGEKRAAAIVVAVAIAASAAAAIATTPACSTHLCDYNEADFGTWEMPGTGTFVGNAWESTPLDADWLDFNPAEKLIFFLPADFRGTRSPLTMLAYLSEVQHPVNPDFNTSPEIIALAAGNGAEMTYDQLRAVATVHNGTCQKYYVRFVVTFDPAPDAGLADAGVDAATDAAQDAPADAGTE